MEVDTAEGGEVSKEAEDDTVDSTPTHRSTVDGTSGGAGAGTGPGAGTSGGAGAGAGASACPDVTLVSGGAGAGAGCGLIPGLRWMVLPQSVRCG